MVRTKSIVGPDYRPVPCGKCNLCRIRAFTGWEFRLQKELERSINPIFGTLTYAPHALPECVDTETGELLPTLSKKDLRDFFKRLRYYDTIDRGKEDVAKRPLRYYAVGEYGTRYGRPHYHFILYNLRDATLIRKAWTVEGRLIGRIYAPSLNSPVAIGYVLKYVRKLSPSQNKLIQKPFSSISNGLGSNYLTEDIVRFHHATPENSTLLKFNGSRMPLTKYFKEKLFPPIYVLKNPDRDRQAITDYMATQAEARKRKKIRDYMLKKRVSREIAERNYAMSREFVKFERQTEIF